MAIGITIRNLIALYYIENHGENRVRQKKKKTSDDSTKNKFSKMQFVREV